MEKTGKAHRSLSVKNAGHVFATVLRDASSHQPSPVEPSKPSRTGRSDEVKDLNRDVDTDEVASEIKKNIGILAHGDDEDREDPSNPTDTSSPHNKGDGNKDADSEQPTTTTSTTQEASPTNQSKEMNDSRVFVDCNYHVMYKEYNLRRSTGSPSRPAAKKTKPNTPELSEDGNSSKRLRDPTDSVENESAKKLKVDGDVKGEVVPQMIKESSSVSPHRKLSLSQGKKSRKKKQISATQKTDSSDKSNDKTVCSLCYRKDSSSNLGFLYGPYKPSLVNHDKDKEAKSSSPNSKLLEDVVWVHEDCAVWAPGVCYTGGKLLGLYEAIADGQKLVFYFSHASFYKQ